MQNLFVPYLQSISQKFSHEETSEMGYRTDFEILIKGIFESINVRRIDHDARARQGNKPDFIVLKNDIPILYIETKDIGTPLDKEEKSEQMTRYYGYMNLVLTDYLEFRFYRNGISYQEPIRIAEVNLKIRTITPTPEKYEFIAKTLLDFPQSHKEPIQSGLHLAKVMGGKAQRIRENVKDLLLSEAGKNSEVAKVYETIKRLLVHDLSLEHFADMYAQTLVYGLFVARFYDDSQTDFTRQEARDLIPVSNPFLGSFFDHIAGRNFEKRLEYIVDELCDIFSHANIKELLSQYYQKDLWGKMPEKPDPVIHFYEDFLQEYDSELRRKMGAYYTPLPVVSFIVQSVDKILEHSFGLARGLADTAKSTNGLHCVQILDPAVGTGTFISKVIDTIYSRQVKLGQQGGWPTYVHHELLPRIFGFELMMAPYTIAHLKISMKLQETGFKYFNETRLGKTRLGVYLTNSLEDTQIQQNLLAFGFGEAIAKESEEAAKIKNEKPIMVIIGNPPYSVSSSNKGPWIQNLIKDYKTGLNEQNIQPLSDDYIKFIRYAEHFIQKNESGIVAMITNNSYIDGIIHRQMRKHLLETFSDIYILDLHGNSKKGEKSANGGKDENVFDIQQGVAISIFIRKGGGKKGLATVHHAELYGKRENKFKILNESKIQNIKWEKLVYSEPYYFFVPKDFRSSNEYENGFKVDDLFPLNSVGIVTSKDAFLIDYEKDVLNKRIHDILSNELSDDEFEDKYKLKTKYFDTAVARSLARQKPVARIVKCFYRPFDIRYLLLDPNFIERTREKVMRYMLEQDNIGLVCSRQNNREDIDNIQVVNSVIELKFNSHDRNSNIFPLYLNVNNGSRVPNLNKEIVIKIENTVGKVTPEDIFDYIYAVLYSPSYREKYKEFLKIDFPRVPYPRNAESFKKLVELGAELRLLHLLEAPKVNEFITTYPADGSNIVEKVIYKDGKIFINSDQYFGNVPEQTWNFWIGGYQPAQKWLKDRKDRILTNEDIEHYQKIIVALVETQRIMEKIDKIFPNDRSD